MENNCENPVGAKLLCGSQVTSQREILIYADGKLPLLHVHVAQLPMAPFCPRGEVSGQGVNPPPNDHLVANSGPFPRSSALPVILTKT